MGMQTVGETTGENEAMELALQVHGGGSTAQITRSTWVGYVATYEVGGENFAATKFGTSEVPIAAALIAARLNEVFLARMMS